MSTPQNGRLDSILFPKSILNGTIVHSQCFGVSSDFIAYIIIWRLIIFSLNDDTWHLSWSIQVFVVDNRKRNKLAINNTKSAESKEQRKDLNN